MLTELNISSVVRGSLAGTCAALALSACHMAGSHNTSRPNVIIVLTDDQGYGDLSVHGNPVLQTPVLDRLHSQSIRFTDFHSAPMCTPTRGQLMTGRDALDNGATMVCMGRSMIREELPTMADIFRMSGYQTAHFGKWHLGDSYPYRPQDRGFDETVHHSAWGIGSIADHHGNTYWNDTYWHNNTPEKYQGYCTDVWFDLTIEYIRKHRSEEQPFFIYLATNCPHSPHLCDDKYSDPYLEKGMKEQVAGFFGQIANIDENMDRLLGILEETGLADNTILIYMTDNGTSSGHEVFNAGMRGHKTEPYEGGHRVPLFIRWPAGKLGKPRDIDVPAQVQDILPTLTQWCNLNIPDGVSFDGSSLVPAVKGKRNELQERILVVEYENPYRPEENRVVIWKKWRLVKDTELYDLSNDPGQTNDVAEQYPEVLQKLKEYYAAWKQQTITEYQKPRYIHLGSEQQNPVMLYSSDWQGSYADNSANLFAGNQTGFWDVMVDKAGTWKFTLSRWHPASGLGLNNPMNDRQGRNRGALPVEYARLKVGNFDQTIKTSPGQPQVVFTLPLQKGIYKVETWFLDKAKQPLCSAYYTEAGWVE